MAKYLKVIDREDLVRDPESKAILANDLGKLQEHRRKKEFYKQLLQSNQEVDNIKQEVKEIKDILGAILAKLDDK